MSLQSELNRHLNAALLEFLRDHPQMPRADVINAITDTRADALALHAQAQEESK